MRERFGWAAILLLVLAFILVPFFLYGDRVEKLAEEVTMAADRRPLWIGSVLAALLAADIFLPVPSSIVSTALGATNGAFTGAALSFAGMTTSCVLGYALGIGFRRAVSGRLISDEQIADLESLKESARDWFVVVTRPVPVLAEAAVIFAGMGRMGFGRFVALSSLANLGISAAYASVGAYSARANSFLLAFLGAVILPGILMLVLRSPRRR